MTKLRFYFILCKDEETLLRSDEIDVTITLHSLIYRNLIPNMEVFMDCKRKKRSLFVIFVSEIQ